MNGLDKIIEEIAREAEITAAKTIDEAKSAAKRVIDRAKDEARAIETDARDRAELEYKRIITRAQSAGELTCKNALLREKQRIIDSILNDAHIKLVGLDDKNYFDFMTQMLNKYASDETGEIILSDKDKSRVTDDFIAAAEERRLKISDKTRGIDGGFILSYGDIEENCSIEAIMEAEKDRLHDKVNEFLFRE